MRAKRSVVITGASSGIGQACAAAFAADGSRVFNLDLQDGAATEALCGAAVTTIPTDIGEVDAVRRAFSQLDALLAGEPVDVLVCSAAAFSVKHFLDVTPAEVDRVLAVNVRGMVLCCQEAARRMARVGRGHIVAISSTAAMQAWADEAVYAASKGATAALVRGMAVDLAPFGIVVNAVAPGSIDTPGVTPEIRENAAVVQHDLDRTPLARWGRPEEIAAAVRFLAETTFMTGQSITVDGGFLASGAAFYGSRRDALTRRLEAS